jgi:hypothetical protein
VRRFDYVTPPRVDYGLQRWHWSDNQCGTYQIQWAFGKDAIWRSATPEDSAGGALVSTRKVTRDGSRCLITLKDTAAAFFASRRGSG